MTILKWIVVLVVGGYLSFVALLYLAQRQFLFIRDRHIPLRPSPGCRRPRRPSSRLPMANA